jgi:DNA polymerase III delta prime subunit
MSVNKVILWERWRPKKIEDIILAPRIRKQFESGVSQHYIFHGHYGTGKTSLARILIGRYSKETPYLELNCSMDTSIDVLREEIQNFCRFTPMFESDSSIKYVFLDEFERVSAQFQDAFKAFIEKYNSSVRFIITTNHINKISDGLKSRIKTISFDCLDIEEEKFLKTEIYKKIKNEILEKEGGEISKDSLVNIINKKFPDFRGILVELQDFLETGELNTGMANVSSKTRFELYSHLYEKKGYEETYHFLMSRFGAEKIDSMIRLLGKPFIDWSIENGKNIETLFECNFVISDYAGKLETDADPIVLGMTIIGKLKSILSNNV